MLKCYIFPFFLYGAEPWAFSVYCEQKLEDFEMWIYRRILRIPCAEYVTNLEVLRRMEKGLQILHKVKKRDLQYLGHIIRGPRYDILQLIIQGEMGDGELARMVQRHVM